MEYGLVVTKKNPRNVKETKTLRGNILDLTTKKNYLVGKKDVTDAYIFAYDEGVVRSAFTLMLNCEVVREKVISLLKADANVSALETILEELQSGNDKVLKTLCEDLDALCFAIMFNYNVAIRDCKTQLEYFGYKSLSKYAEDVGMSKKDARIVLYESFMESIATE